ncbi:33532_t:CDS:2 [Gigaspora margarita]|uniref:33532_t:CDS:1 n=1 Tax=Gigaspora margarita TaxID=4874 RepID=A0ABN7UV62_GIGMA|nr:33532_t:CDS:2 [Gigaspora margarita]
MAPYRSRRRHTLERFFRENGIMGNDLEIKLRELEMFINDRETYIERIKQLEFTQSIASRLKNRIQELELENENQSQVVLGVQCASRHYMHVTKQDTQVSEIFEKEFKKTINTLNKLEIKVKGLISQYLRLEKRNKFLETKYELLKTENKRLFSKNETLQIEKEQYKAAVKHSVEVATRSGNAYKNEIHNYKEVIQDIYYQIDNLDVNKLNSILCTNEIPGFQNLSVINELPVCYSNLEDAINHSKSRIHKIDDTGNIINSGPSLHRSHSFYDQSTSENFDQESTSNRNMVVEESQNKNL